MMVFIVEKFHDTWYEIESVWLDEKKALDHFHSEGFKGCVARYETMD